MTYGSSDSDGLALKNADGKIMHRGEADWTLSQLSDAPRWRRLQHSSAMSRSAVKTCSEVNSDAGFEILGVDLLPSGWKLGSRRFNVSGSLDSLFLGHLCTIWPENSRFSIALVRSWRSGEAWRLLQPVGGVQGSLGNEQQRAREGCWATAQSCSDATSTEGVALFGNSRKSILLWLNTGGIAVLMESEVNTERQRKNHLTVSNNHTDQFGFWRRGQD